LTGKRASPRLAAHHARRTAAANARRYSLARPGQRRCAKMLADECRLRDGWWHFADYASSASASDGLHSQCRSCRLVVSRLWKERNRQHCLDYAKEWGDHHPERKQENVRRWKKENPIRNRIHSSLYRHRKNQAGVLTDAMWAEVVAVYGKRCLRCGSRCKLTIDHVVPLTKGGKNTQANVQPLCHKCNCSKGTKTTDYRPDLGRTWL
jgi:5-methylcytosine-specific restriction endonuclease McrA